MTDYQHRLTAARDAVVEAAERWAGNHDSVAKSLQAVAKLLAADAARAVPDEEVEIVLTENQRSNRPVLHTSALRAAGFTVIRTEEARDGGE